MDTLRDKEILEKKIKNKEILKRNKILITGGTGFIGYHLAKKCSDLNWSVDSISTKLPKKNRKVKKVKYLIFDISKKKEIEKNLSPNYDYVVNLAGYVDHSNKNKTLKSHFNGCKNIANFFLNSKVKKFVQIGSCIEYGKIKSPKKKIKKNFPNFFNIWRSKTTKYKILIRASQKI